ncbi:hypothetical protein M406DRAFT_72578 [Cryphonectria parasitica EP155]|uniref:SH3 domain-containing protein n=1 Tax=Cryphonectria parasitica (strain ATCC 38755 / EP155) TaxID=660469 RepID=A0A9P5CL12_CRYP1|nr:uncharacterized protein M406DRAFT_72578 [Cryphonectria parasitica EP155]KAF3762588.1 hypothetical protein M406DRAFT_72578 [Cryphonectria parasitica EP155]
MSKIYIAPCTFIPRTPGELSMSKYDHIIVSDIGHGWSWGKNLSQQGQEGIFPKRYLGVYSNSGALSYRDALDEVASVCSRVDMFVATSVFLTSEDDKAFLLQRQTTLNSLGPLCYLTSACAGGIWDKCLNNFVAAFEMARVKVHEYLRCVENLKRLAGMLDSCVPKLTAELRKYPHVVPAILRNAECMQTTLKGIINTATVSFDSYKPGAGVAPRSFTSLSGSTFQTFTLDTAESSKDHAALALRLGRCRLPPVHLLLLSYPTLQGLTIITCLICCSLQFRSYTLSPHGPGDLNGSDFFNNLQSVLMQLLTTYTGLVPAVRTPPLSGRVSIVWISLLSIAGLVLNFAALGTFFHDNALAPLLGFFGNVVQTITVLQLGGTLSNGE